MFSKTVSLCLSNGDWNESQSLPGTFPAISDIIVETGRFAGAIAERKGQANLSNRIFPLWGWSQGLGAQRLIWHWLASP